MRAILNTVDILLGYLIASTMNILMQFILLLVAVFTLLMFPYAFLEDAVGISELDVIEIGLLATFLLVIWRFFKRGRQLCWSWWRLTRRFVFVVAVTFLVLSLIEYLIILIELFDKGSIGVDFMNRHNDLTVFLATIVILLAIYAGAPLPNLWNRVPPASSHKPKVEDSSLNVDQPVDEAQSRTKNHRSVDKETSMDLT